MRTKKFTRDLQKCQKQCMCLAETSKTLIKSNFRLLTIITGQDNILSVSNEII